MRRESSVLRNIYAQSALLWAGVPLLAGFLPYYLEVTGFDSRQIGILMALNPLMAIVVQPFIGLRVDRSQSKNNILLLLILGAIVASILYPLGTTYAYVLLASLFLAVFQAALTPVSETITLEALDGLGKPYGPIRLAGTVSYSVLAVAAGFLIKLDSRSVFLLTAVIGGLNLLTAWRLPRVKGHQSEGARVPFRELFQDKTLLVLLPFLVMAQFAIGIYQSFFPMYYAAIGGTGGGLGVIYFISAMSELPFLLFADKLIRRLRLQGMLIFSMAVVGLRFLLLFAIRTPLAMYPIALLHGMTYIIFAFSLAVYVNKTIRPELRASGQTLLGVVTAVGRLLGSLIGGFVVQGFGIHSTMFLTFAFCFVVLAVFAPLITAAAKKAPTS